MIAPQLYGVILHDRRCFPDRPSLLQAWCWSRIAVSRERNRHAASFGSLAGMPWSG